MTASELNTEHGVERGLIEMMDAVFADYRDTHSPTGPVNRDTELWSKLDQLGL